MLGFVDVNALVFGMLFGLSLAVIIVAFLIHAAINTPQSEEDHTWTTRIGKWTSISRYEGRRTYLHSAGHDPDLYEW